MKCIHDKKSRPDFFRVVDLLEDDLTEFKNSLCKVTDKIEVDQFLLKTIIVTEGIILERKTTNRFCCIVSNYSISITIGNVMKVFIEVLSLIISIARRISNVTNKEFMLPHHTSAVEKSGYKQILFEKKYVVL